jgi:predicted TIM-barrel fold metal-dependent hydrolase
MATESQIIDANTMIGLHPTHKLDMSIERLVAEMDKHGIAAGLILSTIGLYHSWAEGNAAGLEAAKTNKRLVPVATVNPLKYFGSAGDLQAIRAAGFRIFKFCPADQGWEVGSAAFRAVLRDLASLKVPVMLDTPQPGEPSKASQAAADYPAPVVLCSISLDTLAEALELMVDLPQLMIETHELHVPGALKLIADRVGADRIVFGSGAPRRSIASSLHYVLNSELSEEDKQKVLGGNIRRILEAVQVA